MKPLLQKPRYGLTSASLWSLAIGLLCLYVVATGGLPPLFLLFATAYLLVGIFLWQEQRWAAWLGCAFFSFSAVMRVIGLVVDFQIKHVFYLVFLVAVAWDCYRATQRLRAAKENDEEDRDEEDDEPLISFVLLRVNAKYLEAPIVAKMAESAWGGRYSISHVDDDGDGEAEDAIPLVDLEGDEEGFVMGESPLFIVQSTKGLFLVHNHDQPYWDEEGMEAVLSDLHELRLRKAVANHTAWAGVDLVVPGAEDDGEDPAKYYPHISRMIMELADEETLVIFRPETGAINVWSDEVARRMTTPDAHEEFAQPANVPVIQIADDDPELVEATKTAKERWPEFVTAFENRTERQEHFGVKVKLTRDDETEFIWLDVIGLEPRYIHGTLANDPVDLGDLKLGSQVEVPLEDMQDWVYVEDGEPVGLFSHAALMRAQAAWNSDGETSDNAK